MARKDKEFIEVINFEKDNVRKDDTFQLLPLVGVCVDMRST